jgi:methyltransferase
VSHVLYTVLIGVTALERLIEVKVSNRNRRWSIDRGGREFGESHYPFMVCLHTAFLVACPIEVWLLDRAFDPMVGWGMLVVALLCQIGRWWCIQTLGPRWNTRVVIVPGLPPVQAGPYHWIRHPNYVVVALEGVALPMIHGAVYTAVGFTLLNVWLMWVRIRCENSALSSLPTSLPESQ